NVEIWHKGPSFYRVKLIVADAKQFLLKALEKLPEIKDSEREGVVKELHASYMGFSTAKADYSTDYVDVDGMRQDGA
ncbi:hypothetical protein, partial [Peribacillus frigoritolerans]|uniref:hypothetical protein n=1 Tax=Peribacillus frigoritolerans TaxID=450367 RepID=UPI0020243F5E